MKDESPHRRGHLPKEGVWVFVRHVRDGVGEAVLGLVGEATDYAAKCGGGDAVTAVVLGSSPEAGLESLGAHGVGNVLYVKDAALAHYNGELYAEVLYDLAGKYKPRSFFMVHGPETSDLAPRLAALMGTPLVTRAVGCKVKQQGKIQLTRPVFNGYLYEQIIIGSDSPFIITFLPSALNAPESGLAREAKVSLEPVGVGPKGLKTKLVKLTRSSPEASSIEDADVVIAGGRGVGKGEAFDILYELAGALKGSVGGTRPVIDSQTLPFERQIGQTGKTVCPDLMFACGISGANEFTAGMEKSRLVIAINKDSHARIFRYADLCVIGDVHQVVEELIRLLRKKGMERADKGGQETGIVDHLQEEP